MNRRAAVAVGEALGLERRASVRLEVALERELSAESVCLEEVRLPEMSTMRTNDDGMQIGALSKAEAEYDFAIVLKPLRYEAGTATPAANMKLFYRKHPHHAKTELLKRLHGVGLHIKKLRALDGKQFLLKIKAPDIVLELGAEKMKLKKQRRGDQMWIEFGTDIRETFMDFDDGKMKFLDSEKQSIVYNLITSDDGAGLNQHSDLLPIVEQMLPLHKANLKLLREKWVCYWHPPVPVPTSCTSYASTVIYRLVFNALNQPLDDVAMYFGEKIAFYFAWLEMYTQWLLLPTIVGIFLFWQQVQSQSLDQPMAPFYALFMALWASAFLVAWKRRANTLAYRWGVLGYEDEEVLRPEFYGEGPGLSHYPNYKRWLKYSITMFVVLVFIAIILVIMYYAFTTRDALAEQSLAIQHNLTHVELTWANLSKFNAMMDVKFWFYFLITPMLYGLCIPMFDLGFSYIAQRLTNWENHKTESAYQSALILKVFPFRFVHVFATLYYYAFTAGNNLIRVAIQLATFMLSGQMWNNVVKTGVPLIKRQYQMRQKRQATDKMLQAFGTSGDPTKQSEVIHKQCVRLEQASSLVWDESQLGKYDTFEDYTEMLIQFGYVSFFSIAFPLAPFLALVNNLISLRADAFKLCYTKQRPIALKTSGIGIWFPVLQLMTVLAVITNCLHIAFTTTQIEHYFPKISSANKVWVVFAAEHSILLLQVWIAFVIPSMTKDIRDKVRTEKAFAKNASAKAVALKLAKVQTTDEDHDDENDAEEPGKSAL
ncbi:anoctamin [Thraustotheca clavata]|uniref:Anoctamin n=1 Tax=Thraustotheca clavata TaxID=74557 RepID=A0A1V9ZXU1_9STRA|nr:anoctamin [Thraustotheca clavata]